MKIKLLLTAFSFLFSLKTFSQSPNWLWAKAMGTGCSSIALDVSGNVYTTGYFMGTVDFDPGAGIFNLTSAGNNDIFISKLDGLGNFVWAKAMGGTDYDYSHSIALDPLGSGVYTTGSFIGTVDFDPGPGTFNLTSAGITDIFISKLDSSGNFVWAKALGGAGGAGVGESITTDASGYVYTTGYFTAGTIDFDPGAGIFNLTPVGDEDIFISKLDSSGNFVWAKAIGGISDDYGYSIAIDLAGSGDIYTTGRFGATVDFDPGAGTFNLTATGGLDVFISKLDSSGNFLWAKRMGGVTYASGYSIAVDPSGSGDVYSTGVFQLSGDFNPGAGVFNLASAGLNDIYISKLDSSGNFVWAKRIGGTGEDWGLSLALNPAGSGNVYTTGYFEGTVDFNPGPGVFNLTSAGGVDIFISRLDGSGNFLWAKATGGTGYEGGQAIARSVSGNVHVTGNFNSPSIAFDSDTVTMGGGMFIAKLACATSASIGLSTTCHSYTSPSGNYIWTTSGTYLDTISNSAGCDSVITITLTFIPIDTSITQNGVVLTANAAGVIYQWLDCNNGFAPIIGDTNQVFTPSVDGSYAAAITEDGCTDTSACRIITGVGTAEISFKNNVEVFPNPTTNQFTINNEQSAIKEIEIYDMIGEKILHRFFYGENKAVFDVRTLQAGIYFLIIRTENNSITQKLIIQK